MWGIFGKPLERAILNTRVCMLYQRYVFDEGWGGRQHTQPIEGETNRAVVNHPPRDVSPSPTSALHWTWSATEQPITRRGQH